MPDQALYLEKLATRVGLVGIVGELAEGYRQYMGEYPSPPCLACNVGQVALETGNGQSMWNWNPGNVKWAADWPGHWTMYRCNEVIGGRVEWFDPPHPQTWFRAFESCRDGMAAQVEFLASRERYQKAWHQFFLGKADAGVRALAEAGYFTTKVDAYARAVTLIYGHVLGPCSDYLAGKVPAVGEDLHDRVTQLVAESLYDPALRDLRLHEDLVA
jgi:hypothetical protein